MITEPFHDIKTERQDITKPLPRILILVPVLFCISCVAAIALNLLFFFKIKESETAKVQWKSKIEKEGFDPSNPLKIAYDPFAGIGGDIASFDMAYDDFSRGKMGRLSLTEGNHRLQALQGKKSILAEVIGAKLWDGKGRAPSALPESIKSQLSETFSRFFEMEEDSSGEMSVADFEREVSSGVYDNNIYGKNAYETSRIDSFLDSSLIFARASQKYLLAINQDKLTPLIKEEAKDAFLIYMNGIESALNFNESPFIVGDQLTLADICYFCEYALFSREQIIPNSYKEGKWNSIIKNLNKFSPPLAEPAITLTSPKPTCLK